MKQVTVTGVKQAAVVDVPTPKAEGNRVVVKVHVAPMCTEFKGFVSGDGAHGYGHEAVGEVVEVAQPGKVKVGDRVVAQPGSACGRCALCTAGDFIHCEHMGTAGATMAQYLLQQDWLLTPIPADVSYEMAGLAICGLGPTFAALDSMQVTAADTVLITGLGPVGLGGVVNARYRGARVIGVDSNPHRAKLALELGAEAVFDPSDVAKIRQVDANKSVDCAGLPAAHRLCIDATRRCGDVAFVGWATQPTTFIANVDLIQKGLRFHGVWHYNLAAGGRVLRVIQESPVAAKLITHRFSLGEIQQAWETQVAGNCGKVILHPWA